MASTFQNKGRALEILGLFPAWNISEEDAAEIVKLMGQILANKEINFSINPVGAGYTIPQIDATHAAEGKTLEDVAREHTKAIRARKKEAN